MREETQIDGRGKSSMPRGRVEPESPLISPTPHGTRYPKKTKLEANLAQANRMYAPSLSKRMDSIYGSAVHRLPRVLGHGAKRLHLGGKFRHGDTHCVSVVTNLIHKEKIYAV
ncbi:hypothetical protein OPQ81_003700 [Rhizoctonia solani]|nr:hypothetical protein OPQ81_003700 [Rhizoctonia solani]